MPPEMSSNRRAQPVRQTRQHVSRETSVPLRHHRIHDREGGMNGSAPNNNVEIFPAITHFADAITALPKELVRHFTLLKEVDAKVFPHEEDLHKLVDIALNMPTPTFTSHPQTSSEMLSQSTPAPTSISGSGSATTSQQIAGPAEAEAIDGCDPGRAAYDDEHIPRRQLFRQCGATMAEMLLSLDEKNHVISTATEALGKQLRRLDEAFSFIENEISEEARYGSTTHWAYTENRVPKSTEKTRRDLPLPTSSVPSRRDVAAVEKTLPKNLVEAERKTEAESRKRASDRRHLLSSNRRARLPSQFGDARDFDSVATDDDADDEEHELNKGANKAKKQGRVATSAQYNSTLGLGIKDTQSGAGSGPHSSKRRKVEKTVTNGNGNGVMMEKSMSAVFASNGTSKPRISSPRETPAPEVLKKKSRTAVATNGQPKKRNASTTALAMSPPMASSPLNSTFPEMKLARTSPGPPNGRPGTGRARQNSTQSIVEASRQRPSSSASNKLNGGVKAADLSMVADATGRSIAEIKVTMRESAANSKGEHMIEDVEQDDPEMRGGLVVGSRKDSAFKQEENEGNAESMVGGVQTSIVMTKSGRASKPSTPALAQFPEPVRSRSSRNASESTAKRSHKKGAGQAAQILAARAAGDDLVDGMQDDDEDIEADADEPRYCYCNGVSYGEMVACDYDGCAKEWFHLDCVGLKTAPVGKAKWYCDDCKEIMKGSKRFNGR